MSEESGTSSSWWGSAVTGSFGSVSQSLGLADVSHSLGLGDVSASLGLGEVKESVGSSVGSLWNMAKETVSGQLYIGALV